MDASHQKGFFIAAVLYVIIANIGYRLVIKMTTERIINEVKEDAPKASLGETLKTLGKNKALIGLILSSLGTLTAMFLPNALSAYFI